MIRTIMGMIKKEEKNSKKVLGMILAVCCALTWIKCFLGNIVMLAALSFSAVCFMAMGFLRIETKSRVIAIALNVLWGILFVLICISTSTPLYFSLDSMKLLGLNFLCAAIVCTTVLVLTGRWKLSMAVGLFLVVMLITANACVFQFRAVELSLLDFLSLKTAISVAGQYELLVTKRIAGLILFYLLFAFSGTVLPQVEPILSGGKRRLVALALTAIAYLLLSTGAADIIVRNWRDDGTVINGYLLNFYAGVREMRVEEPELYSLETVEKIVGQYPTEDAQKPERLPNIIVIMDEAFVDFQCFENELDVNQPILPFIDSLNENVIKGYAMSSVFGGNTANSEFEFLSGHNMLFMPTGSVPYQQYIREEIPNLTWVLRNMGYTCEATHPYGATGWCRNIVYPYLGFEKCTFLEDYPQEKLLRYYISDEEVFDQVLLAVEEKTEPLFLYAVTMQNHGDYYYEGDDFVTEIELQGEFAGHPEAEQYLNALHATDRAVEKLITALAQCDEETVVLLFGDHYPKIENSVYDLLNGGTVDGLHEQMNQYKVPFFIWANYEIPTEYVECTSLSYLASYLLECSNIPLTPYYQFLRDAEEIVPAFNAHGYLSNKHGCFVTYSEAQGEEKEILDAMSFIQYNSMFDKENRIEGFFAHKS